MTTLLHNIDSVRAEIVRLENAEMFEQDAWNRVQRALIEQDRPSALADCQRRMATARGNAKWIVGVDWAGNSTSYMTVGELLRSVKAAAQRGDLSICGLMWCGSDYPSEGCCEYHSAVAVETVAA